MKKERISECLGRIKDEYIDEAVLFFAENKMSEERRCIMRKSKAAVTIIIAAVITASIAIGAAAISANLTASKSDPYKRVDLSSYVPGERDFIRTELHQELCNRVDELFAEYKMQQEQESYSGYYDVSKKNELYHDAYLRATYEQALKVVNLLKKYNSLDDSFLFRGHINLATVMEAAINLHNSSEELSDREDVLLLYFLSLHSLEVDQGLRERIDEILPDGFHTNQFITRDWQSSLLISEEVSPAPEPEVSGESEAVEELLPESDKTIPGKLYPLNLEEGKEPVIRALKLTCKTTGGAADDPTSVNGRESSDENIRFIFEFNERIDVAPETDLEEVYVHVIKHTDDPSAYSGEMTSFKESKTLCNVGIFEQDDKCFHGEFYVNSIHGDAGYYDLVFSDGIKPVAVVMIKLYDDTGSNRLKGKTDAELQRIMDDELIAAKERAGLS